VDAADDEAGHCVPEIVSQAPTIQRSAVRSLNRVDADKIAGLGPAVRRPPAMAGAACGGASAATCTMR
jgi:hypothetical protein